MKLTYYAPIIKVILILLVFEIFLHLVEILIDLKLINI